MIVCSIPAIVMTVYIVMTGNVNTTTLMIMSYSSLIMNFVISVIIIYFCQDMMNGRELKSE